MITLLSPAKSLNFNHDHFGLDKPEFIEQSLKLNGKLRRVSAKKLEDLMSISRDLAVLNVQRNKLFSEDFTQENSRAAIYTFNGGVYQGFDAHSLDKEDIQYAQNHIRILSGLYGLLKPLDKMQAYRLEMGTRMSYNRSKNLYEFWKDTLVDKLLAELNARDSRIIINAASDEYFKAVKDPKISPYVVNVKFKEFRGEQLKFISFNAKKARGLLSRYIIKNRIESVEALKGFNLEDYYFAPDLSTQKELLFVR